VSIKSGTLQSEAEPGLFGEIVGAYVRLSGVVVPAHPWVFAGWVAGAGGWLDYNATRRGDTSLGASEVAVTLARLRGVRARMDALLMALQ
jgi:hypothetical protein